MSTTASAVLGLVLAVLTWLQDSPEVLPLLPSWAQGLILLVVPPAVTLVSGWLAPHTPRLATGGLIRPGNARLVGEEGSPGLAIPKGATPSASLSPSTDPTTTAGETP